MPRTKRKGRTVWEQRRYDAWWESRKKLHDERDWLVAMANDPTTCRRDLKRRIGRYATMRMDYSKLPGLETYGGNWHGITEEELQRLPELPPSSTDATPSTALRSQGRIETTLDNDDDPGSGTTAAPMGDVFGFDMAPAPVGDASDLDAVHNGVDDDSPWEDIHGDMTPMRGEQAAAAHSPAVPGRELDTGSASGGLDRNSDKEIPLLAHEDDPLKYHLHIK